MVRPRIPMRASISIGSAGALLLLAGCAFQESPVPSGKTVRQAYEETEGDGGSKERITIERESRPGSVEKTRPVIYPPKVFAVWVPEHLDRERDFKIGSHWIYMKLRDSSWVEEAIDREPASDGAAAPADTLRLKSRLEKGGLRQMLVPYVPLTPKEYPEREKPKKEFETQTRDEGDSK